MSDLKTGSDVVQGEDVGQSASIREQPAVQAD
jgi:hypothetical protein